jgi:uncharacterized protein YndB with AHSA1/START domain
MPDFALRQPDAGWATQAQAQAPPQTPSEPPPPVTVHRTIHLSAPPPEVFAVLADLAGWSTWFGAMKKVRIDGPASGVGALRTVWVAGTRVQERFLAWEPDRRLTFAIVASSVPGLAAMVEDWALSADPATGGTRLEITIGVEPAGILRRLPKLVHRAIARSTRGGAGLAKMFP